jgi:hypothetical protein
MSKIKKIAVLAAAFSAGALAYGLAERDQANTGGTRLAMLVPRTAFANLRDVKPDTPSTSDRQQRDDRLLKQLRALVQEHESAPAGRVSVPPER